MKKALYSIVATAAVLVSCNAETDFKQKTDGEVGMLRLSVFSQDAKTRATQAGLDDFNENTIANYWYYLASDAEGTQIFASGYVEGNEPVSLNMTEYEEKMTDQTCYVYIFANVPQTYTSENKDVNGAEITCTNLLLEADGTEHEMTGEETHGELKSLSVVSSFFDDYKDTRNRTGINGSIHTDNQFVMWTAEPVEVKLEKGTATEKEIGLDRVAAKVYLNLNIVDSIKQYQTNESGKDTYVKTWDAKWDNIQVYFLWASSYGKMNGEAIRYDGTNKDAPLNKYFVNYPRYANFDTGYAGGTLLPEVTSGEKTYTSYVLGEIADDDKRSEYSYEYPVDAQGNPMTIPTDPSSDDAPRYTKITFNTSIHSLTTLPFYTYPIQWTTSDAQAPFIKIILPWTGYNEEDHETVEQGSTEEFYYKITLPNLTKLESNTSYSITLDIAVLGSQSDEFPVELSGQYYVVDWSDPTSTGGDLDAGRYLSAKDTVYMYSNSVEIPVTSSHPIKVSSASATYPVYSSEEASTGTLTSGASADGNSFKVTASGHDLVTLEHNVVSDLASVQSRDLAPITYTLRIEHSDDADYAQNVTVIQYPPIYVKAQLNTNYTLGTTQSARNNYLGYVYVNGQQNDDTDSWQYTGGLYASTTRNPNMYVVSISVLDDNSDYIIGDPRVSEVDNLGFTFTTAPSVGGGNRSLSNYYPTNTSSDASNIIAPTIRIVSSYGRFGGAKQKALAERRCAAYQEDGYPAGRWRLPTTAEIQFISTLSAKGLIPQLFSGNYWSASSCVRVDGSTVTETSQTTAFARCVYDEWYWSSDRVNLTTFTWGDQPR